MQKVDLPAMPGVLEIPHEVTEKARRRLAEGFKRKMAGQGHQVIILEEGAKFHLVDGNVQAQLTSQEPERLLITRYEEDRRNGAR